MYLRLLALALLLVLVPNRETAAQLAPTFATPSFRATGNGQTPDLQETLEKGLRARRPQEFQFIDNVVTLVQLKILPQQLVETTFLWARRQHARIPFPYFRRALQIRAARLGLFVPQ